MKVACFSPFPPKKTGVAAYSEQLALELRRVMELACYDFCNDRAGDPLTSFGDFGQSGRISDLRSYDAVLYHLGNNPHFHLDILRTLRHWPGIVVLHDVVLYYLFAGLGQAGLLKYLWLVEGRQGADSIGAIRANSAANDLLGYSEPERHPLTPALFPYATRIIVHNTFARRHLVNEGYGGPIHVIPSLDYPVPASEPDAASSKLLRQYHGIQNDELVVSCLGLRGRTKRIAQVCRALAELKGRIKFRFLVVGEGEDISRLLRDSQLNELTILTGFVNESDFWRYLAFSDVVVNLRYPSMGESSATLIRAMTAGKACLVTRDAAFAELPDNVVWKIAVGPGEEAEIAAAISKLATDSALRRRMGQEAAKYAATTFNSSRAAGEYARAIQADMQERDRNPLFDHRNRKGAELVARMLWESIERAIPPHLSEGLAPADVPVIETQNVSISAPPVVDP